MDPFSPFYAPYLTDPSGEEVVPIWSRQKSNWWCSLLADPSQIPEAASKYLDSPPFLLRKHTSPGVLRDLDFTSQASWYNPAEHWLGWTPTSALAPSPLSPEVEDPIAFVFNSNPVDTIDEWANIYGYDSEKEHDEPSRVPAGARIGETWQVTATYVGNRVYAICKGLAVANRFYCRDAWLGHVGDIPAPFDEQAMAISYPSHERCQEEAVRARRNILSGLAFLAWFESILPLEDSGIAEDDIEYIKSLRLKERPKAGVMYCLSRDYHEANFLHLMENGVPCHYPWTASEKEDQRFLRLSPEYWNEYSVLRAKSGKGQEVDIRLAPSYSQWEGSINRYDWFFQDNKASKRGGVITTFYPTWVYKVIHMRLYGAEVLVDRNVIRAYAKRFKAAHAIDAWGEETCVFFHQNPLGIDEPSFDRVYPVEEAYELSDFKSSDVERPQNEIDVFYEPTVLIRERSKNLYAPREGRKYNTYNGLQDAPLSKRVEGRSSEASERSQSSRGGSRAQPVSKAESPMSPTRRSERAEDLGMVSRWAAKIAGSDQRQRSSRSLSPRPRSEEERGRRARSPFEPRPRSLSSTRTMDCDKNSSQFEDEYSGVQGNSGIGPSLPQDSGIAAGRLLGSSPSMRGDYRPLFTSRSNAVDAILAWAPSVTELEPPIAPYTDIEWNTAWLDRAILVCRDPRSLIRLKTYAACVDGVKVIEDVLELAIRFGIPFSLFIKMCDARLFRNAEISALQRSTLDALYQPGYVDLALPHERGGAALYGRYRALMLQLLSRPNAVAFISQGGILRLIAEFYDPDLVRRFAQGPSLQVSECNKGDSFLLSKDDAEDFYTTDQVSPSEVAMLLGHIPGDQPSTEYTLWPSPATLESESTHMRGYVSHGVYAIFQNLKNDILVKQKFTWCSTADWKGYLRTGCKGLYAPSVIPKDIDFTEGKRLFGRSFPADWSHKLVTTIRIPELFEPYPSRSGTEIRGAL
ncbi:hypothetical protein C8R47DRAFT_1259095 [Mycena vitilis]|nr:hypothetical protein C8R47DRAFT_1259095 [Mycena vitilis]